MQIAQDFDAQVSPGWQPCVSSTAYGHEVVVKDISIANGASATFPINRVGTAGSNCSPLNVAAVLSWKTGKTGRSYRGRTYIGAIGENDTATNELTNTILLLLTSLAARILNFTPTVIGAVPVVASRKHLTTERILSASIDAFVDSQRRRLTGRGR